MAATRQPPSFAAFHHPAAPPLQPPKHRPHLQPSAIPMQPFFASMPMPMPMPGPGPQQCSPRKARRMSPTTAAHLEMNCVSIPPPQPTLFSTDSPTKKMLPQQHYPAPAPRPQQPLFATFNSNFDSFEQANFYHPAPPHHEMADFAPVPMIRRANLRRSYSDATPAITRPLEKEKVCGGDEEAEMPLPEPEDMPAIEDDGNKPSYSYAQMIGMAILRAPNRRLTLAQIYEWISSTFAFYREDSKQGWHNSIRHNLSLNKAFQKMERPKGDAGKGSYWVIQPGMEATFLKDRIRKAGASLGQIHVHTNMVRPDMQTASQHQHQHQQPVPEPPPPPPFLSQPIKLEPRPQTAPAVPDLSSDATLPASDAALDEGAGHSSWLPQPQSPPPDAINSSPPVAIAAHRRSDSSPSRIRRATGPRHKRNAATMDDSGYFSSIESSILRPNANPTTILTSELDVNRPRKKPRFGRAEDEIQRLRSSSHDHSPSHPHSHNVTFGHDAHPSSPLNPTPPPRRDPATPAVFKKPKCVPASVSPHTQLMRHRKAMQEYTNSPLRNFGLSLPPSSSASLLEVWSPLKYSTATSTGEEFEIFSDAAISLTPSPVKSTKRPSTSTPASTTAKVLSNVLGTATARLNARTPTRGPASRPILKPSPDIARDDETDENHDDIFDWDQYNENDESDENFDLTRGFEKI
ncbi:hypothetical protein DV735_g5438, partial [Chaetothyriales sp. CBS 134920]